MKSLVMPYKMSSKSGKKLADLLNVRRIAEKGKPIDPSKFIIINWGRSTPHERVSDDVRVLNRPEAVGKATNKLTFFKSVREEVVPKHFTSKDEAESWMRENVGKAVVCRTKLTGHSGEGIIIADNPEELVQAQLYTEYVKKTSEYRVHFTKDKGVLCIARKARDSDTPNDQVNWRVRNMDSGFIFAYENVDSNTIPSYLKMMEVCEKVFEDLGLDFGAIDVIYNTKGDFYKVLEVNTACGLNHTVPEAKYKEYFSSVIAQYIIKSRKEEGEILTSEEVRKLVKGGRNPLNFAPVILVDQMFWRDIQPTA